jgi:hypothetical protein
MDAGEDRENARAIAYMPRVTCWQVLGLMLGMQSVTRRDLRQSFGERDWMDALNHLKELGIVRENPCTGLLWVTRWNGVVYV